MSSSSGKQSLSPLLHSSSSVHGSTSCVESCSVPQFFCQRLNSFENMTKNLRPTFCLAGMKSRFGPFSVTALNTGWARVQDLPSLLPGSSGWCGGRVRMCCGDSLLPQKKTAAIKNLVPLFENDDICIIANNCFCKGYKTNVPDFK